MFLFVIHGCFLLEPFLQLLMAGPRSDVSFIFDLLPFTTTQLRVEVVDLILHLNLHLVTFTNSFSAFRSHLPLILSFLLHDFSIFLLSRGLRRDIVLHDFTARMLLSFHLRVIDRVMEDVRVD